MLPRLFGGDHLDGTLEQRCPAPGPLSAIVAGKAVLALWISTALPLVILFAAGRPAVRPTAPRRSYAASLALGTPTLAWLGSIGAALTLGACAAGSAAGLAGIALAVPVLIFGAGAESARAGLGAGAHLAARRRAAAFPRARSFRNRPRG
ncbi:MAG: heme exporter protein CcmB [Burkholderiaceae bacterium]